MRAQRYLLLESYFKPNSNELVDIRPLKNIPLIADIYKKTKTPYESISRDCQRLCEENIMKREKINGVFHYKYPTKTNDDLETNRTISDIIIDLDKLLNELKNREEKLI